MRNKRVNIGIVGGGITGLVSAYELTKLGHRVTVIEKESELGGLAGTFRYGDTYLEKFYHHFFSGDMHARKMISELSLSDKLVYTKPKSGVYTTGDIAPYSSIVDFCKYPSGSLFGNIKSNAKLFQLSLTDWKKVDGVYTNQFFKDKLSPETYEAVWRPLLENKFGDKANNISLAWFQARIKSRSSKLGYLNGSNKILIDGLTKTTSNQGGKVLLGTKIISYDKKDNNFILKSSSQNFQFSHLITALSPFSINTKGKPSMQKKYMSAISVVCILKEPLTKFYWTNLNDKSPFLALIEHTNMVDKEQYNNKNIVYLGIYTNDESEIMSKGIDYFQMEAVKLFKNINPNFKEKWLEDIFLFKAENAQHIADVDYYKNLPQIKSSTKNLYQGSLGHIYPYDRGVDKAIWLGKEISKKLLNDLL